MILNLCAVIHDHTVLIICRFYGEVLNVFNAVFHVFIFLLCKALCAAFHVMKGAIQIKFIIIIIIIISRKEVLGLTPQCGQALYPCTTRAPSWLWLDDT